MPTRTSPARRPKSDETQETLTRAVDRYRQGQVRRGDVIVLSDLTRDGVKLLAAAWPTLPLDVRERLVREMGELAEERVEFTFGRALRVALTDESAVVRQLAVAALWEDESSDLLDVLLDLLARDSSEDVRAEAASGLARFADQAALGALPEERGRELRTSLGGVAGEAAVPTGVRRRALEAVSVFGREPRIGRLIAEAFVSDDPGMRASGLYAMGRSMDPRWLDTIIEETASGDAEMRYEAARACGQMADDRAVPALAELTLDPDAEVRYAAIGALGQIGGRAAVRVLRNLNDEVGGDDEVIGEALEEALAAVDPLRAGL